MKTKFTFLIALIVFTTVSLQARPPRVGQTPYGSKYQCALCHVNPGGGGTLTPFGNDAEETLAGGAVDWGLLALLDSDGDGFTNGEEFQDPNGEWTQGSAAPGDENLVTNPNDPDDFPQSVREVINNSDLFSVGNAFPNPFNAVVELSVDVKSAGLLDVNVYDQAGNKIKNLYNGFVMNSNYSIKWNGKSEQNTRQAAGMYFIVITLGEYSMIEKVVLK